MNESPNRFDLEQAIANWRRQLTATGVRNPQALDELESHLRDEVERQTNSGTSVQTAFDCAVKQIGSAAALDAEFRKIGADPLAREQKWMRRYSLSFPVFYLCLGIYWLRRMEMSSVERTWGFMAVVLTCLFIWGTQHYHRFLPAISGPRRRFIIQIASVLSWMIPGGVFMNFVLPHLNLSEGRITVTVLWLMAPLAALSGIIYGLGEAAHRASTTSAA